MFGQLRDDKALIFQACAGVGADRQGGLPTQMKQHCLGVADAIADAAVTRGLAGLLAQPVHLTGQRGQHIVQAGEVGFRRAQTQFGLMTARMQAADIGRVL